MSYLTDRSQVSFLFRENISQMVVMNIDLIVIVIRPAGLCQLIANLKRKLSAGQYAGTMLGQRLRRCPNVVPAYCLHLHVTVTSLLQVP